MYMHRGVGIERTPVQPDGMNSVLFPVVETVKYPTPERVETGLSSFKVAGISLTLDEECLSEMFGKAQWMQQLCPTKYCSKGRQ